MKHDVVQYILATSNPKEVMIRQEMIAKYGIKAGIDKTIENLGLSS